jgi:predicted ATPase
LALAAEQEVPVLPLAIPDPSLLLPLDQLREIGAVRLFVMRARALEPGFALTTENVFVVAEICRRLDGLPLALELAAAWVKVLPPAAMLARLERRLPLLTGGARDLPTRQRTLRDTIAWSYDLLDTEEEALLRRLAIFAGGWTLEAAEAVTNPDGLLNVLEGMASLVDKSLVRRLSPVGGEPRYTMLETIREFALEQFGQRPDDVDGIRRAHANYFAAAALAERVSLGAGVPAVIRRMRAEEGNLHAMLAYLLDTGDSETALRVTGSGLSVYWVVAGGQFTEGRAWLERALREGSATSAVARGWGLNGLVLMSLYQGDLVAARTAATGCRALAEAAGDPMLAVIGPFNLSLVAEAEWRMEATAVLAQEAVAAARRVDDLAILGWSLIVLGNALSQTGDLREATPALDEARSLFRSVGGVWGEAAALTCTARVARTGGNFERASQLHGESLRLRREAGVLIEVYDDLVGLAEIACLLGCAEPAARLLGADDTFRTIFGSGGWGVAPLRREQTRQALIEQLGAEQFQRAWDAGRALSTEDIITEALVLADELADAPR